MASCGVSFVDASMKLTVTKHHDTVGNTLPRMSFAGISPPTPASVHTTCPERCYKHTRDTDRDTTFALKKTHDVDCSPGHWLAKVLLKQVYPKTSACQRKGLACSTWRLLSTERRKHGILLARGARRGKPRKEISTRDPSQFLQRSRNERSFEP